MWFCCKMKAKKLLESFFFYKKIGLTVILRWLPWRCIACFQFHIRSFWSADLLIFIIYSCMIWMDVMLNPMIYVNLLQVLAQNHQCWFLWMPIPRSNVVVQAFWWIPVGSIILENVPWITRSRLVSLLQLLPPIEKSNSGGSGFPVGILVSGLRNSSKKGCISASLAVGLANGLYCNIFDIKSIASGGVLNLKIYTAR